ncbi:MAG: hypothetical protein RSF88_09935, partial [Lachnospiraceae bacterium]
MEKTKKWFVGGISVAVLAVILVVVGIFSIQGTKEASGKKQAEGHKQTEGNKELAKEVKKMETSEELSYLALDINPSMELMIEKGNRILSITAANEDAAKLLEGLALKGMDLEEGMEHIVKALKESGYLGTEVTNDLLISVSDGSISEEVLKNVNAGIQTAIQAEGIKVSLMTQKIKITEEDIAAAHGYKISAGKHQFIQQLLKGEEGLSMEELASTNMQDLTAYAVQNNIPLEKILDEYQDAVEETAEDQLETTEDQLEEEEEAKEKEEEEKIEAEEKKTEEEEKKAEAEEEKAEEEEEKTEKQKEVEEKQREEKEEKEK